MKKEAILLIAIALLSATVIAATLYVETDPLPDIELEFTEAVKIIDLNLTREDTLYALDIEAFETLPNNPDYAYEYVATPRNPLMNGEYTLTIFAKDIVDNEILRTETIVMDVDYMKIWISDPPYFVSPVKVFDLTLTTAASARECRYAYLDVGFENAIFETERLDSRTFRRKNFNSDNYLSSPEVEKKIYVYCNDTTGRINPAALNISYDTSAPVITVKADPVVIVEKIAGRIFTKLKVTSDDKVVCRYSNIVKKPNTTCEYIPSNTYSNFINYDWTDPYDYLTNPVQEVDVTAKTTNVTGCSFEYKVNCRNAAGFYSKNITVPVVVNLIAPVTITKISPKDVSKNTTVILNFTTSKTAECAYSLGDLSGKLDTTDRRHHVKELDETFDEGKYKVSISCSAAEGTTKKDFEFIIDTSPPETPVVNSPNAVCADSISAVLTAEDELSGIAGFNYTLESVTETIAEGYVSGNDVEVELSDLNLSADQVYTFKARAKDKVGFWSEQGIGNSTLYDETGVSCDTTPPLLFISKNRTSEGYVVYLECLDRQTYCNNNSFTFSFSEDSTCSGFPGPLFYSYDHKGHAKLVQSTTYFCFEASDAAGNTASGYEFIEIREEDHCSDEIRDSDETDVDCGGPTTCERCEVGQICVADSDCKSQFCDAAGFCRDVACDDFVKNGFETDVDCGGMVCDPCEINQSCIYDSDCTTNFCLNTTCTQPTCTDSYENGNETDVDCGGSCAAKCADGGKCKIDSDCISGYCSGIGEYKICAQKVAEVLEEKKKIPVAKTTFISLGLLSILSSLGYLSYLKYFAPKAPPAPRMPPRAPPRPPARPPSAPPAAPPAQAPPRKESDFEKLGRMGTKLERLGKGREEEELERIKSKSAFEKLGKIRKKTKLEKIGRGKSEEEIKKLKPKKKPKKAIEELKK